MMRRALGALTFLGTVAAAQQPPPAPAPQPAPPQTPAPGTDGAAPAPTSLPTAVGTPTLPPGLLIPAPTLTLLYRYVFMLTPLPHPATRDCRASSKSTSPTRSFTRTATSRCG